MDRNQDTDIRTSLKTRDFTGRDFRGPVMRVEWHKVASVVSWRDDAFGRFGNKVAQKLGMVIKSSV